MTLSTVAQPQPHGQGYAEFLHTLSEGSVLRNFDPYLDIAWDSPALAIDPNDPRWALSPEIDPLGATAWYQALPLSRQIEIGRWRQANLIKVGAAFESILIRGMMQYLMKLPNQSPEFRYCLHEMTEECNHIQMFQELVNRIGDDVPGMRPTFRALSPLISIAGGYAHTILFIGILGGEEPIDHYQKSVIRHGAQMPPTMLRCMEIHIAEEARHISFAHEFLKEHLRGKNAFWRGVCSLAFPLAMRWLAGEIMAPHKTFAERFEIPRTVMRAAFWESERSREILSSYFGDMRMLATEIGLMNPAARSLWRALRIDGRPSRHRGEPEHDVRSAA
jgi:hypothetical protein